MSANAALSKQKVILALLAQSAAQSPEHESRHRKFRDCLHHIPHYVSRLYSRAVDVRTTQTRCSLKLRCPKCMDPVNIRAARKADRIQLLRTASTLGGGDRGEHSRVWLLQWEGKARDGNRMAKALGRDDGRRIPAARGQWGGEICGTIRAIIGGNGPKYATTFVFNNLVFGEPSLILDVDSLCRRFPGLTVTEFHGHLDDAWTEYLRRWATETITLASPEQVVAWMQHRGRMFNPLGRLRQSRADAREGEAATRLESSGRSTMLGYFSRLDQADVILSRLAYDLPLRASTLLDRVLLYSERERIMATLKTQVRTVLTPSMNAEDVFSKPMTETELRTRLEELRLQNVELIRLLQERDKDSTTTRAVALPKSVN